MNTTQQSQFQSTVPDIFLSLINIHTLIAEYGIEKNLSHLVMLRASQINGCSFCVAMHTQDARKEGESNQRLDSLIVFRDMDCFDDKEKLALEWTEALTTLDSKIAHKELHSQLLEYYSAQQISALTSLIGLINVWNRIRISEH
ncbi:carboxymuconolactone decarboxylase family protein [Agaribacterium sp. ZY112]|uniref:carboxymuconolactone decarboxylase family protein n=1 Tax=Agaribacterium sp. ZY112 TaxID=3233574 RepID=UPI003525F5BF